MPSTVSLWKFSAMDSLFFRDGRPMNAGESAWIDSQFPPTGQTLQGAIRAAILDYVDADIQKFQGGENCLPANGGSLREEIGDGGSIGNLDLCGPFVACNDELFFPVPLDLVKNKQHAFSLLSPSEKPVTSDMGCLRLPSVTGQGFKTEEGKYISSSTMTTLLQGKTDNLQLLPLIAASENEDALADREPKVGLARDNQKRTNTEGKLFAIAPIRPRTGVTINVQATGIKSSHCPSNTFVQKLGGEGKVARLSVEVGQQLTMPVPHINQLADRIRFKIVFISPALLEEGLLLPVSNRQTETDFLWQGAVNSCELKVVTACIDKPVKIGGWNLMKRCSEPLRPFIPAGSVFFCEADISRKQAVINLHNSKTGKDTQYGFGHILIGKW